MSFYLINIYFAIFCLYILHIEDAQKKQNQQKRLTMYLSIANLHKLVAICKSWNGESGNGMKGMCVWGWECRESGWECGE